jgi:hypothetical protein
MPRAVVLHVRWPEGYFTDKYPSSIIPGYIYSAKGEPLTFLSRLPYVPGHIVQLLLKILVGSWNHWSPQDFVPLDPQSMYLVFELGMVALRWHELLRLQICDLSL